MITVSNTTEQTLQPGQSITFDNIVQKSGCAESFRNPGSSVRTGIGLFEVSFHGNIGGTTAATGVQLMIELDGSPLATTEMDSTPAAVGDLNNVSAFARFGNSQCVGGGVSATVTNTGTSPVVVAANSTLSLKRVG